MPQQSHQTPSCPPQNWGRKQLEKLEQHMVVVGVGGVKKADNRVTLLTPHTLSLPATVVSNPTFFLTISVPKKVPRATDDCLPQPVGQVEDPC